MKVAVHTFGCKVNLYESEYIINLLKNKNYSIVDFKEEADIYIINTCSVTNEADKKDRQLITRTRKKHQNAILVVMGCYSQLNPDKIDADIVIGNKYKSDIVSLIEEYLKNKEKIVKVEDISKTNFENMYIDKFNIHTRAFVKIQDGCNAFCAYCAIPYARGGIRSKELNTVIDEVTNLVNNGYKEIVLTGIDMGSYGLDIYKNYKQLGGNGCAEKLIDDLKELHDLDLPFEDPIYQKKMKAVLGHTYFEVLGGIILGVLVVFVCYIIMKGAY